MSDKIYEYKDAENWFIAKWDGFNYLTCFGDDEAYEQAQDTFHRFCRCLQVENLQVHVVQMSSSYSFLRFLADCINEELKRQLKVQKHKGSLLVTENEKLLFIDLPRQGVDIQTFFGQDSQGKLGDTILIATKNEGKTREFRKFFEKLGYQVENLHHYPELPEVAETGVTFEENARLKAETIARLTGKIVLADDSGLKVDALGGLPGVWSARFSGPEATDASNNAKLLHELAMVFDKNNRSAQFHCTLVMAAPATESLVVEADWEGYIGTEPRGENGFGYDPLFLVGESEKTSAELSLEEKNQLSHRAKALEKLMEAFPKWQANQNK